jgi:hypothetical protein
MRSENRYNDAMDACFDIVTGDPNWNARLDASMSVVFLGDMYAHYVEVEDYEKLAILKSIREKFMRRENDTDNPQGDQLQQGRGQDIHT